MADLIEISRKRANSLFVAAPQPSAIFVEIPSAARVSCERRCACPARPKWRARLCSAMASACARCHASMCLKSCMPHDSDVCVLAHHQSGARRSGSFHFFRLVAVAVSHLGSRCSHLDAGLALDVAMPARHEGHPQPHVSKLKPSRERRSLVGSLLKHAKGGLEANFASAEPAPTASKPQNKRFADS